MKTQGEEKASLYLSKMRGVKGSNPGQIKQHIKVSLLNVNFARVPGNDNLGVRLCYLLSWEKKKIPLQFPQYHTAKSSRGSEI